MRGWIHRLLLVALLALAAAPAAAEIHVASHDVWGVKAADLQASIDGLTAGGTVHLGKGVFPGVTINNAFVNLIGEGATQTVFNGPVLVTATSVQLQDFSVRAPGAAYSVKLFRAGGGGVPRCSLRGLWLGASFHGAGDGSVIGLYLDGAILTQIEKCTISFCTGDGVHIQSTSGTWSTNVNRFENCTMNENGTDGVGYGVNIVGGSIQGTEIVSGNMQDNVTGEINANSTNNLMIRGVDFERNTACTDIVAIGGSNPVTIDDCNFVTNPATPATRAFEISSCGGAMVRGCRMSGFPINTAIGVFDQNSYGSHEFGNVILDDGAYISDRGGRILVGNEVPLKTPWQPSLADWTGYLWLPSAAGTGDTGWGPPWTATGVGGIALATPSAGHLGSWARRTTFTSSAANQEIGIKLTNAVDCAFWTGDSTGFGGFYFCCTFRLEDWANTARLFIGLASNAAGAPVLNDLAGLTGDFVGLYHQTTDGANVVKMVTGHATVNGVTALNNSGAGPLIENGRLYRFEMRCPPKQLISCTLTCLDYPVTVLGQQKNASVVTGWTQVVTPSSTVFMAPQCELGNAASGNRSLGIVNLYVNGTGR